MRFSHSVRRNSRLRDWSRRHRLRWFQFLECIKKHITDKKLAFGRSPHSHSKRKVSIALLSMPARQYARNNDAVLAYDSSHFQQLNEMFRERHSLISTRIIRTQFRRLPSFSSTRNDKAQAASPGHYLLISRARKRYKYHYNMIYYSLSSRHFSSFNWRLGSDAVTSMSATPTHGLSIRRLYQWISTTMPCGKLIIIAYYLKPYGKRHGLARR